jgi:alanine racemase
MDLFAVDVSALPERAVRRGDFATLVGGELDIDTVATQAGTISYELLTNFGPRYRRIWIENTPG